MDLSVELESIDMWTLLMQMTTTYIGQDLIYPYPLSFIVVFNTEHKNQGAYLWLNLFSPQNYFQ